MRERIFLIVLLIVLGLGTYIARVYKPSYEAKQKTNQPVVTNAVMLEAKGDHEIETKDVVYYKNVKGYYAAPKGISDHKHPGVVMMHEWWGLNDQIKDMARNLASHGYQVLAVDLHGGKVAKTSQEAMKLVSSLDQNERLANMEGAVQYLKDHNAGKIASLGWCFGGGQSLQLSLAQPLDATILYYGSPLVTDADKLEAIKWPVLGIFGDKDQAIPVNEVKDFKDTLDDLGIENEVYIYAGVGHAFANPSGQNYAPKETKDAWDKTLAFLKKHLEEAPKKQ